MIYFSLFDLFVLMFCCMPFAYFCLILLLLLQIDVVIEDKEFLESTMNGESWKAGKFSHSLRCLLWSEHLGLHSGEVSTIEDYKCP